MSPKQNKLSVLMSWFEKSDSAIVNHNCPVTNAGLESLTLKQINAVLKIVVGTFQRACNDQRNHWAPKFHEQRNAKRDLAKQLVLARNLIKRNHPGNFYLEVGEMDKAICKAMDLDYCNISTADYERVLGILAE